MKIGVTGAGGRLGAALARELGRRHEVRAYGRAELDLGRPGAVAGGLGEEALDALINCAALTNVDYCEGHREEAFAVNAESVGAMARWCARRGTRLVHISTDYVFAGDVDRLLREDDPAEPVSVYGESKKAGELAALEACPNHLVVRVSWVFGPDRPSFIDMVLDRAQKEARVEAIGDKYSSPLYTLDAAPALEALLARPDATGIFHLCNPGRTTWREYGEFALRCAAECGVPLKTVEVGHIPIASMKNFVARRPVHTAMDIARFEAVTGHRVRPWPEAVHAYVRAKFGAG